MAGGSIPMSKIREIWRYKSMGLSERQIAKALKHSRNTVKKYLLAPVYEEQNAPSQIPEVCNDWMSNIDWERIKAEVEAGVSLNVLWEEEVAKGNCPIQYPGFWKQFSKRFPNLPVTMIRHFQAGERVEIDFCDGIDILLPATGEIIRTHLFMGVLCASRYAYGEFTLSQKSEDFLSAQARMLKFFGGVPQIVSPDNLKSAVNKTHRYDPEINPAYTKLAEHFGFVVVPARVRTPKDKAIIERTLQIFQRWFFARVRHRTFTGLAELNHCLLEHLKLFHQKQHRIFRKSRQEMFEEERLHLNPLPSSEYVVETFKRAKLHSDCHFEFDKNLYSAPWKLRGKTLDIWASSTSVTAYFEGERVAMHGRSKTRAKPVTDKSHYPPEHQAYLEITPCRLREEAKDLGQDVYNVINDLMSGPAPLAHLRRCQGILALRKKYTTEQLNAACKLAREFNRTRVPQIESLAKYQRPKESINITRTENPFLRGDKLFQ